MATTCVGIMIDTRLNFKAHIACGRAAIATAPLTRIIANISGPSQCRRVPLANVSQSVLMYTASIWWTVLRQKTCANKVKAVSRLCDLRVDCRFWYHIWSYASGYNGLRVKQGLSKNKNPEWTSNDRRVQKEETGGSRRVSNAMGWDRIEKMDSLIIYQRDIHVYLYLRQFLSGHFCFREYLHRFGHDDETECSFCSSPKENAEPTYIFFLFEVYNAEKYHRTNNKRKDGARQHCDSHPACEVFLSMKHFKILLLLT